MRNRILAAPRALADWFGAEERARLRAVLNWLFVGGVIVWLALQLDKIGWVELWQSRPTTPAYYLLVLVAYLNLPVADALIYRRLWGHVPFGSLLAVCMRKRIYNSALIGYSGEVFMLIWARSRVAKTDRELAHDIKDTNILSAIVSNCVTAGLIIYLLFRGTFWEAAGTGFAIWAIITVFIAALTPVGFLFRRHFMMLSASVALAVLGIHTLRFAVAQASLLGQWHVELPDLGLGALIALLTVQMLVSRIPFVPNRDLLFISIAIAMTGSLDLPRAEVAGLLITTGALYQVLHLVVIVATSLGGVRAKQREVEVAEEILEREAHE